MPKQLKGEARAQEEAQGRSPADDLDYMGDLISSLKTLAFDNQFLMLVEILRLAQMEVQRTKRDIKPGAGHHP